MSALTIASKANQAETLPALLVAEYAKQSNPNVKVDIEFKDVEKLSSEVTSGLEFASTGKSTLKKAKDILHSFLENIKIRQGETQVSVQEWIDRAGALTPTDFKSVEGPLLELDAHLTLRSYVVGYTLTPADIAVWGALRGNKVAYAAIKKGAMLNVARWFKFIEETNSWIAPAVQSLNAHAQERKVAKSKGANYDIALPDTDKGVVTRFPPEPSYVD